MFIILILGISSIFLQLSHSYVLLQVRKQDDNHANIDAIIHKVVPSDKFEKFAQKIARKQTDGEKQKTTDYRKTVQSSQSGKKNELHSKKVEALSMEKLDLNLTELIENGIKQFSNGGIVLRALNDKTIKPKTIQFRTGESSVLYEVNSKILVDGIREILSSDSLRGYLDQITRRAAVMYRAMRDGPDAQ